jgi:ATP-binding cassette subfamily F protein uup
MNLLSADQISKAFSEKWLFNQISFGLETGQKLALVGSNGTGKSTLLKVLNGNIIPDHGHIALHTGCSIGYLAQEPDLDPNSTVEESIFNHDNPMFKVVKAYEQALQSDTVSDAEMSRLLEQMDQYNAWDFEKKAEQILGKLGIHQLKTPTKQLSGGQKKRVALAQLLLQNPDILLLDEPTNHLDLEAIEWLENHLKSHNISLIMVTHDRYFLDAVATQIIELDRAKVYIHHGNYAYYLEKKQSRATIEATEMAKAKQLLSKELEWMRRMPKARGTKSKSRIQAYHQLEDKVNAEHNNQQIDLSVKSARLGNKIIELEHINKSFQDRCLINDFTYLFKKQDRIGIIGKNGVGKSTLLNILTQTIQPDKGTVVHGPTLKIGYYTQHSNTLTDSNTLHQELSEIADYVTLGGGQQVTVAKLLDMFLFPPAVQHTPIAKLSGGERRRLQLLKVLIEHPNFLILDEPTNDLDIDTLNVLEDFLQDYDGCIVLVSHDRYFMDQLVEHLFVFEDKGFIRDFYGNYSDYKLQYANLEKPAEKSVETAKVIIEETVNNTPKKKLSYKEQRELEQIDLKLPQLEAQKEALQTLMNAGNADHQALLNWAQELEQIQLEIDELSERWLILSE